MGLNMSLLDTEVRTAVAEVRTGETCCRPGDPGPRVLLVGFQCCRHVQVAYAGLGLGLHQI